MNADSAPADSQHISDTENESEETIPKLVFQCEGCKIIVGDSMAFSCSTEKLRSITLAKACNVTHSNYIITAKDGSDVGCSYVKFFCSNCDAELGKFYCTTSAEYDPLRDKFTFSTDKLTSYELGKNQLGKLPEKQDLREFADGRQEGGAAGGEGVAVSKAKFEAEIFNVEKVLLSLVQRTEALEARSAEMEAAIFAGGAGARKRSVPF